MQRALNEPPFTQPRSGVVGSGFRAASAAYDASLQYTAEIDESDRVFCYVSKAVKVDAQCVQRLYTSDRTYRELLRNAVLTSLQEVESEADYLARCAQAKYASSGPASPRSDGLQCGPDDVSSADEVLRLMQVALESFDKLFASVRESELKVGRRTLGS